MQISKCTIPVATVPGRQTRLSPARQVSVFDISQLADTRGTWTTQLSPSLQLNPLYRHENIFDDHSPAPLPFCFLQHLQ